MNHLLDALYLLDCKMSLVGISLLSVQFLFNLSSFVLKERVSVCSWQFIVTDFGGHINSVIGAYNVHSSFLSRSD